jgi:hypothetical protein
VTPVLGAFDGPDLMRDLADGAPRSMFDTRNRERHDVIGNRLNRR